MKVPKNSAKNLQKQLRRAIVPTTRGGKRCWGRRKNILRHSVDKWRVRQERVNSITTEGGMRAAGGRN